MSAREVILLRHGQTDFNAQLRMQGQIDIPLNETGQHQAEAAAARLVDLAPDAIVASDLSRAADTAKPLAEALGLPVTLDERLRERSFGVWEGLNREEIQEGWAEEFQAWREGGDPSDVGVETRAQLAARVGSAVADLAARAPADSRLVVVSHGSAISLAMNYLLELPTEWRGLGVIANCTWSALQRSVRPYPTWQLAAFAHGA